MSARACMLEWKNVDFRGVIIKFDSIPKMSRKREAKQGNTQQTQRTHQTSKQTNRLLRHAHANPNHDASNVESVHAVANTNDSHTHNMSWVAHCKTSICVW